MEHKAGHTDETTQGDEPACCSDSSSSSTSVTIQPTMDQWASALSITKDSDARSQLGLDTDRPVVMSGHQPIVFHSGILAKLIALDEASKRFNAQAVWIVPDMDAVNPGQIRMPIGQGGALRAEHIELYSSADIRIGLAGVSHRSMEIDSGASEQLEPMIEWLDQYASVESLAQQFGYGVIEYVCEQLGIDTPRILFASELMTSPLLAGMVEIMRSEPMRCVQAYNNAVGNHPDAGVRLLAIEDDRIELPLWGCRKNESRVAIDTSNVDSFESDELLPRGLLMSGLARLHLADLFIHGTGGFVYDLISEEWFKDWLGEELSPMAMVTATHRLDLGFDTDELDSMQSPRRAIWAMHHAKHTPRLIGLDEVQQQKDALVAQIAQQPPKSQERARLYRELQALLVLYRTENADAIGQFKHQADEALAMVSQRALAIDRTWAFVFFSQESLEVLDRATRDAMS